jgi:hypothetical protein
MNKINLIALIVLLLSINAFSASELTLQINESGQIQATHVSDNDYDIEFVDIFIISETETQIYSFEDVSEGFVFSVSLQEDQQGFYDFMDDEGTEKGIGSMLPIYGEQEPSPLLTVIENAWIEPNVTDDENALYELQVTAEVNESHALESIYFEYLIGEGSLYSLQQLSGGPGLFTGNVLPFTGEISINSRIKATDLEGREFTYSLGERIYNLMALNPFCSGQEDSNSFDSNASFSKSMKETKPNEFTKAFFAEALQTSSIHLMYTENQADVYASHVFDDDGSIQLVDVFYDNGTEVVHQQFQNVVQGQHLGISIPIGMDGFYSFFDDDGTITGVGAPTHISDYAYCIVYPDAPECLTAQNLIEAAELNARLDEENLEYYLDAEVYIESGQETGVNEVKFYYTTGNGTLTQSISLTKESSNKWIGSIGPFDDETTTESYATAYTAQGAVDTKQLPPRWDKLLVGLFECTEICFDNIDNDGDGFVDEGCALMPQLYARMTYLPQIILVDSYFDAEYEIANSGGTDANSFSFKTLFDETELIDQEIDSLATNQAIEYTHSLYSGETAGTKNLNIQVDYLNEVMESMEADNNLTIAIRVRLNEFDVNYNYNNSSFLGDIRQAKLRDLFRNNAANADVNITYPSGTTIELTSGTDGIVEFTLLEGGTYTFTASKQGFEEFEGSFEVEEVEVQYKEELQKGEWQQFTVKTEDGKPIAGAEVNVILPTGEAQKYITDTEGKINFLVKQNGTHAFMIRRKEAAFFTSSFNALQTIEEAINSITRNLGALAGETVTDWILFLILLVLAGFAAIKSFHDLKKFRENLPETKRKQQLVLHSVIAAIIFLIPLTGKWITGEFAVGYAIALIELAALFLVDFIQKQKEKTKAIKVE